MRSRGEELEAAIGKVPRHIHLVGLEAEAVESLLVVQPARLRPAAATRKILRIERKILAVQFAISTAIGMMTRNVRDRLAAGPGRRIWQTTMMRRSRKRAMVHIEFS